jgi:autotransporter translocation and assembly factor TamB
MSKKLKWIFLGGVFLVVGAVALIIILYLYTPAIDQAIITALNSIGGDKFKISYQNMSGNLLKRVRLDEVLVTFDDDSIFCKRIEFDYSIFRMTDREFSFGDIEMYQPTVILHQKDKGVPVSPETDSHPFKVPFGKFPDARIGRLSLSGGSLIIKNSRKISQISNIQLALSGQISSDSLNISVNNLEGYWPFSASEEGRGLLFNNLSFNLSGSPSRILLKRFEIDDKHITMLAKGEYRYQDDPQLSLDIDSLFVNSELARLFVPRFPYKEGYTKFSGKLVGMPSDFTGNVQLSGVFDSLQVELLKASLHKKENSLRLSDIDLNSNFGKLTGSLYVSVEGKNNATLAISDANLKKVGILDEPTSISGNIDFDFDNWDLKNLSGGGRISLPGIGYGGVRFDSLKLSVDANHGNFRLLYPSKLVLAPESEFFLSGNFSREQILNIELTTTANRLDTLFDQIGMPLYEGGGELSLKLSGPLSNPDLSGHIKLDSLLNRNVRMYNVTGQIDIKRIIENRLGNFRLDISRGRVGNLELTKGTLKFSIEQNRVFTDTVSFVSDQNEIAAQGELNVSGDSVDVRLKLLSLKYENYVIENTGLIGIKYRNEALEFENFELAASDQSRNDMQAHISPIEGFIRLEGTLTLNDDDSNIDLKVSNTRLEPFNQFLKWKYQLKGILTANVHIEGDISNPWLTSSVVVNDVLLDEHPLGSVDCRMSYLGKKLQIDQFKYQYTKTSFANVSGTVNLSAEDSLSTDLFSPTNKIDLNLDISDIRMENYAFLFDVNFPFQGALFGQMKIAGTMGAPDGILHFTGTNAIVKEYQFSNFDIDGRISPTDIIVDKASIRFLDSDFQVSGFKGIHWDLQKMGTLFDDRSFALSCEVHEDSLNFLYAFIPEIDRIIGDIQVEAQFAGTIDSPQLINGSVEVRGADLYLTKIENPIQNVHLQAQVRNKKLFISECQGRSPEIRSDESFFRKLMRRFFTPVRKAVFQKSNAGDIQVAGLIDFSRLSRPKFDLDVVLNDAYFNYFLENTRLVVQSDNLHISGGDTIAVSGSAVVKKGVVDINIEESEKNLLLSKSTRQTTPYIEYLLTVEVSDNFFIRSDVPFNTFDIEIGGNTQILQEPMGLIEMYGELNIIKGKYFIQFEDFDITSGTINFVNPKEYPELNLTAQKQKNNYLFDLTVSGPLNNPVKQMHTKNLDTNEEIYEIKDQMALLIFGVRFQELSGLGQSAFLQKGEEVLTQTIINQFEKEARYFTGLDRIRITTQDAEENYIDEYGNQADHISTLALGKYIAPNLYLEYQTKLSYIPGLASFPKPSLAWESGNQIYLKYRISQNWSLSSFYQKTLRGNDKVQFDVNWQLDF